MSSIKAIENRLDAQATEALEVLIANVEKRDDVKVTDVQVDVAAHVPIGSPTLDVSVTVTPA